MQIWNPSSGQIGRDVTLPTTEVLAIATYQGTHSFVLLGTKDSKVLLWDIDLNQLVKSFSGHRAGVYAVAITSTIPFDDINNGNDLTNLIIASGSVDHSVRTWNYSTGKRLQKFRHKRSVYSIVITEKAPQPLMVTAGAEYVIRLWDVKSAILLRTFEGHLSRVN
jgi:WD40 repeat protein